MTSSDEGFEEPNEHSFEKVKQRLIDRSKVTPPTLSLISLVFIEFDWVFVSCAIDSEMGMFNSWRKLQKHETKRRRSYLNMRNGLLNKLKNTNDSSIRFAKFNNLSSFVLISVLNMRIYWMHVRCLFKCAAEILWVFCCCCCLMSGYLFVWCTRVWRILLSTWGKWVFNSLAIWSLICSILFIECSCRLLSSYRLVAFMFELSIFRATRCSICVLFILCYICST